MTNQPFPDLPQPDKDDRSSDPSQRSLPDMPDTRRNDGPVGAPGPNDDPEGRGEDEGKGQEEKSPEERRDANGRNPGEPGYGTSDERPDPEPQSPH